MTLNYTCIGYNTHFSVYYSFTITYIMIHTRDVNIIIDDEVSIHARKPSEVFSQDVSKIQRNNRLKYDNFKLCAKLF